MTGSQKKLLMVLLPVWALSLVAVFWLSRQLAPVPEASAPLSPEISKLGSPDGVAAGNSDVDKQSRFQLNLVQE